LLYFVQIYDYTVSKKVVGLLCAFFVRRFNHWNGYWHGSLMPCTYCGMCVPRRCPAHRGAY
jgi:hypothetical protein